MERMLQIVLIISFVSGIIFAISQVITNNVSDALGSLPF